MKTLSFLILSLLILTSCSGSGGGDSSAATEDPIYGNWYYEVPGSTSTSAKGIIGKISKDGTIQFANAYAYSDGKNAVYYVRKSIGTFTRSGDSFEVKYSYETCNPVGSETLTIRHYNGKLTVQTESGLLTLTFAKADSSSQISTAAMIEDKNCNILSKIESKQKRTVANSHSKSFFDRIVK